MTNAEIIQAIRNEIEKRKKALHSTLFNDEYNDLLSFLSALESENPEPYNPVYDEAYLNEKIKKATESWKGVDVDAMLAECRGYDEEKSEKPIDELEVEIALYLNQHFLNRIKYDETIDGFTTFDAWDMAKYFYELGCTRTAEKYDEIEYNRQRAEESVPKDLEEAAIKYADTIATDAIDHDFHKTTFIAGAKWQAEQLLKSSPLPEDTVLFNKGVEEGKRLVMEDAVEGEFLYTPYPTIALDDCKDYNFKDNQKVRVIIVKK